MLEPFEVASAGSMARLSPKGILTQSAEAKQKATRFNATLAQLLGDFRRVML